MPKAAGELHSKIVQRVATVCVIGQGYVGLSAACALAVEGFPVLALDVDTDRASALGEGRLVVPGVDEGLYAGGFATGRMTFTTDADVIGSADVVLICVPTPVVDHRPDLSHVEAAGRSIAPLLRPGSLVVLESTTYPGTTEGLLRPILEQGGLRSGRDFFLAFSPERIDPGNVKYGLRTTPRVVGGDGQDASLLAELLYSQIVDEVTSLTSCRAAEMAKLLENTYRMVNIALVNELATLCSDQDVDVWEVIAAAATKPFGFQAFYPGPGVGGHCIPLDPTYLAWQSRRDTGRPFRLVELAQDINAQMPSHVAQRLVDALNEHGRSVKGARVLALGVTYKPDVGDVRESASIDVLHKLARKGALVSFHDPYVEEVQHQGLRLTRSALTPSALREADVVALLTPHSSYDLDLVVDQASLVFDARGALRHRRLSHVVTL
jgi:UDP-N-acetyl-D-glucosamine dehydrogenase